MFLAKRSGVRAILNPAPAQELPEEMLEGLFAITPNETEATLLTGIEVIDAESAKEAAKILLNRGVENVIITMGKQGAFVMNKEVTITIPGYPVQAVDTTAAGDTFNGALAVALAEGKEVTDAIRYANKAASLSVTREGAQPSIPFKKEVQKINNQSN